MKRVPLFINGEFVQSNAEQTQPVFNPANQQIIAQVPMATPTEVDLAVASAKAAFETWRLVPIAERARVMMRYQALLKQHHDELAEILSQDTGKTFEDAKGDVWRGIEVV